MIFTPRLTIPEKGNKFYNTKSAGGYSKAIVGKPTCEGLNVLANCVGYAAGRMAELCNDTTMSLLSPVNAEDFIAYRRKDLKTGTEPKLGACMVWSRTGKHGHVAIVEQINADGTIVTSESGYNSVAFITKKRKPDARWGQASDYTFLGFIYPPIEFEAPPKPQSTTPTISFPVIAVKKGCKGDYVLPVQILLKGLGYYTGSLDKNAGNKTHDAILKYQKARKLQQDGVFGKKCWESFLEI